jgi:TonB family protein
VFQAPKGKNFYRPMYPVDASSREEGWVILSYMVDTKGRPYEVGVVEATGDGIFRREAVRAIERSTFYPATLNGHPIDSVLTTGYTFTIDGQPLGARSGFIEAYKRILRSIDAGDQTAADDALRNLEVTNLYEDAYWGLAQYQYAARWGGDLQQQLHYLKHALGPYEQPQYLERPAWKGALLERFRLQIKLRHYGEAIGTWTTLKKYGVNADTAAKIESLIGTLEKLRANSEAYDVSGELSDYGWSLQLFKPHFRISSDSSLAEIKLRCDKGYVTFAFDPSIEYHVEGRYGSCDIQLEGTPGTHLTLTQF